MLSAKILVKIKENLKQFGILVIRTIWLRWHFFVFST